MLGLGLGLGRGLGLGLGLRLGLEQRGDLALESCGRRGRQGLAVGAEPHRPWPVVMQLLLLLLLLKQLLLLLLLLLLLKQLLLLPLLLLFCGVFCGLFWFVLRLEPRGGGLATKAWPALRWLGLG